MPIFGSGHVLQPEAGLGPALDQGLHAGSPVAITRSISSAKASTSWSVV